MSKSDILMNEYFDWMYRLVINDNGIRNLSFRLLLLRLFETEFKCKMKRDENRVSDGLSFRYKFGLDNGYSEDVIREYIDIQPCSVLEVMVALSFRIEDSIMDDYYFGDRTGQWFWSMIISLGLATMSDLKFDSYYVDRVIFDFINRKYKPNGEGGLFTLNNSYVDARRIEIWQQAMLYLDEKFSFTI